MNETVKWVLIAVVGYLLYEQFTQGDLATTVGTTGGTGTGTGAGTPTTTTTATTTPAGTTTTPTQTAGSAGTPNNLTTGLHVVGSVTPTIHNALKAQFALANGVSVVPGSIAVIPGGGAYNDAGQDITAQLANYGITPAQLYALMQAAHSSGVSGLNALAAGPVVHLRQSHSGKWVM